MAEKILHMTGRTGPLLRGIWNEYGKRVFISTGIVYLAAYYWFLITEPRISDWVRGGFLKYNGAIWGDMTGRWGRRYFEIASLKIMDPFVSMLAGYIALSLIAVLLIDLWQIKSGLFRTLLGPVLAVAPAIVDIIQYMHDVLFYSISMLTAVLAAYLIVKLGTKLACVMASFLLIVSLCLYQAYLGCFAFIIAGSLLLRLLSENSMSLKEIRVYVLKCFLVMASGCALYFIVWKITLAINHNPVTSYAQTDQLTYGRSLGDILSDIAGAYRKYIVYYLNNTLYANLFWAVCFTVLGICIIWKIYKKIKAGQYRDVLLSVVLLALLPLCANIVYVIVRGIGFDIRLRLASQLLIPFSIAALPESGMKADTSISETEGISRYGLKLILGIGVLGLLMGYSARAYSTIRTWDIGNRAVRFQLEDALHRVVSDEGYRKDMPIVIVGVPSDEYAQQNNPLSEYAYYGIHVFYDTKDEMILDYKRQFIAYYYGVDIGEISDEKYMQIIATKEFGDMAEYPSRKAFKVINGCYVIRFPTKDPSK